jgi:hypothetical protein
MVVLIKVCVFCFLCGLCFPKKSVEDSKKKLPCQLSITILVITSTLPIHNIIHPIIIKVAPHIPFRISANHAASHIHLPRISHSTMTTYASYYLLSPASQIHHKPSSITSTPTPSRASSFSVSYNTPLNSADASEKQQYGTAATSIARSSGSSTAKSKWYDFLKPIEQAQRVTPFYENVTRRPLFGRAEGSKGRK